MRNLNSLKIILIFSLFLFIIPLVSAEYIPHKQNTNLSFSITSNNATGCNVSSYDYPSGTVLINQTMERTGQTFNISIDEGNFTSIGIYCFNIECFDGVTYETGKECREVTPSGSQITSGKAIGLFGSLLLIMGLSLLLFVIGFKAKNKVEKLSFYSFAGIGFVMTILYTVIIMQQTLFGFDSILTGIETFWFVGKMLVWIGFLSLGLVIFMIMLKAWKIKRGLVDID